VAEAENNKHYCLTSAASLPSNFAGLVGFLIATTSLAAFSTASFACGLLAAAPAGSLDARGILTLICSHKSPEFLAKNFHHFLATFRSVKFLFCFLNRARDFLVAFVRKLLVDIFNFVGFA